MTSDQMAKPHSMIGTWNYINGTMSGKIVYSDYGNFTLTIPVKNIYGDYKLEGSWGSMGPGLLTECYANGNCVNNTLTTISSNVINFNDDHGDIIHLVRDNGYPLVCSTIDIASLPFLL